MIEDRLTLIEAEKRLTKYPELGGLLGPNWLKREYKKQVPEYSLIAGWLSFSDDTFTTHLSSLEETLKFILPRVDKSTCLKIKSKLKSHGDRDNTKGTISEIALIQTLIKNKIKFSLEVSLTPDNKDIDIQINCESDATLNIEVTRTSFSDAGKRATAHYGLAYPIFNPKEWYRIQNKMQDKIPKFTKDDITFVAIDITDIPEFGGRNFTPLELFCEEVFTGEKANENFPDVDKKLSSEFRNLVDGVIWFEVDFNHNLQTFNHGISINPQSRFQSENCIQKFRDIWVQ